MSRRVNSPKSHSINSGSMGEKYLQISDWTHNSSLRNFLGLGESPISTHAGNRQLDYIARYIEKPEVHSSNDRCVLREPHYTDRDFLEDCGAFYIQNLEAPNNWCERLHFFASTAAELTKFIADARDAMRQGNSEQYKRLCNKISDEVY